MNITVRTCDQIGPNFAIWFRDMFKPNVRVKDCWLLKYLRQYNVEGPAAHEALKWLKFTGVYTITYTNKVRRKSYAYKYGEYISYYIYDKAGRWIKSGKPSEEPKVTDAIDTLANAIENTAYINPDLIAKDNTPDLFNQQKDPEPYYMVFKLSNTDISVDITANTIQIGSEKAFHPSMIDARIKFHLEANELLKTIKEKYFKETK